MINQLIHWSVYRRGLALSLAVALCFVGWWSFQHLNVDAVPDITNKQVQVNSTVLGFSPEEIERTVTVPIENSMRGIAGVQEVRSITRFGLSQVSVIFKDDVDIYRARQMVSERLQSVIRDLPGNVAPSLGPISTGLGEVFTYSLDYDQKASGEARVAQLMELKTLQQWVVRPRLITVEGVAEVNTAGGFEKQYHVLPDSQKMAWYKVHFGDLIDALERVNKNVGGGYLEADGKQSLVQGVGLLTTIDDLKSVPVKTLENFQRVKVGDIGDVRLGTDLRRGAATMNGEETVLGTVLMLVGENSRVITERVREKIAEIEKTLPSGVHIRTLYDRSVLVDATLGTVEHNLLTGAVLVVVILILLLGHWRAALITAMAIPLALLWTFTLMKPLGISGNLMSLGALDFGIIVDGTVIVLDNCVRRLRQRFTELGRELTADEIKELIYEATVEIRTAAGFGELIVIMVFLPLFGLTGVEGKMFTPMAATFTLAILGALLLSFTVAPALASLWLKSPRQSSNDQPRIMRWIEACYEGPLQWALKHRLLILGGAVGATVLGVVLFFSRGSDFLPQLNEGSLALQMIRPVDISLSESVALQRKSEKIILEFPEVTHVFANIGTGEVATDPMGVNTGDTYVMLKPRDQWPLIGGHQRTSEELTDAVLQRLKEKLPGQEYIASQPIQMRFNELLEGSRADVALKIFGSDLPTLVDIASQAQKLLEPIHGAGDVEVDITGTSPLLRIEPNTAAFASLGGSLMDVLETVQVGIGGMEAGWFYEGTRRYPIVVRAPERYRNNPAELRKLQVGLGAHTTTSLDSVARLASTQTYGAIIRENSQRKTTVMMNIRGRDTQSLVNEAKEKVASLHLPQDYYFDWGGNFKNLQSAKNRLMILTPLALVLVLGMIYMAFGNGVQTLLVFSGVPLALAGGVLGLIFNDLPFSISAGIGFIALCGVAVLNGVVLMNYFNFLHMQGKRGVELVVEGCRTRLRPVLMTAMVAAFGFVPMMLSRGVGAEVQRPLASVVIGGILSSTFLTLIVLPVLYLVFEKSMQTYKAPAAH